MATPYQNMVQSFNKKTETVKKVCIAVVKKCSDALLQKDSWYSFGVFNGPIFLATTHSLESISKATLAQQVEYLSRMRKAVGVIYY